LEIKKNELDDIVAETEKEENDFFQFHHAAVVASKVLNGHYKTNTALIEQDCSKPC